MQIKIRFTFLFLMFCVGVQAQNVSIPYSIYGIGEFQTSAYNRTTGMGSTGIAYRNDNSIIQNNPASYTALQQQIFHIEAGGRGEFSTFTNASYSNETGNSEVSNDFAVTRFAFATKVTKWWGAAAGLMPYTTSNYNFSVAQPLGPGGDLASITYEGSGGIHKAFLGSGFALGKHFSVGGHVNFLFGGIQQTETILDATSNADILTTRNLYLRNANFDFGGQFYTHLGREKKWTLTIGATFTPQQRLWAEDSLSVSSGGTAVVDNALLDRNFFSIPMGYGGGISLSKETSSKRVTFLADFTRQMWSNLGYSGSGYALTNSERYSAGIEIAKKTNIYNSAIEHIYYQAGGFYNKTYLTIDGYPVIEWGGSIGLGVNPLRYPRWGYNLALEYGQAGNYETGALREDFVRLTVTIHYFDVWFTHGRKVN